MKAEKLERMLDFAARNDLPLLVELHSGTERKGQLVNRGESAFVIHTGRSRFAIYYNQVAWVGYAV